MKSPQHAQGDLQHSLKQRHLTMLSLGGVIGAGLFVGSSSVIAELGPGSFITYGLTGILVLLVMRMLGEMAVANPTSGSFMTYARQAMGRWAGFSTGWLYWYFWVIIVGFETVTAGKLIHPWIPWVPEWLVAVVPLLIMTLVNLLNVKSFGEAEYWFASVKVFAIIAFLAIAALYVLHLWPGSQADFANLTSHGGFAPSGMTSLLTGIVVVIFSMTGVEVVTIAAAESENPARNIRKAINSVVFRILVFYVLSTLLIVVIVPWDELVPGQSPFVAALDRIGIPGGGIVLNIVILAAVLSILNSGVYTSSRLLLSLSQEGDAPRWMGRISSKGVPTAGVYVCLLFGMAFIALGMFWPDTILLFLINSSGAVFLLVYLMICFSQLILRKRLEKEAGGELAFKMWLYPVLPILVTAAIIAILVSMAFIGDMQASLYQTLIAFALILLAYWGTRIRRGSSSEHSSASAIDHVDVETR